MQNTKEDRFSIQFKISLLMFADCDGCQKMQLFTHCYKQFNNIRAQFIVMGKDQQRILQLHSLLSKLLDSLCFEVCVNRRDQNSLSLLEIILWRRKGEVDPLQFIELYRSWLQSKSIFDFFSCKQIEIYPKHQIIASQIVQQNFMSVSHITKSLEMLNEAYNKLYIEKKPNNSHQLDQAQKIFSYLDTSGYIHLRLSSMFFFTGATVILEKYTVPINYQAFKIHMSDFRKQACEINGIVCLRGFKNYLLNLNSIKRTNYLENILSIFSEIEVAIGVEKNCLPNIFDDVFSKWKSFPRFGSTDSRKTLQIYRRVFEENEKVFYDEGASIQYFLHKYGEQFVKCFQIQSSILREFNVLLKQTLNRYIDVFAKVSQKINSKHSNDKSNNQSFMTHRKKQGSDLQQPKLLSKLTSLKQRDKTPTKSQKNIELKNNSTFINSRTPTKTMMNEAKIRKQFGSAEKSKEKMFANRQLTPTKSFRQSGLTQSQAYSGPQKSAIKVGVEKDSFYNKMQFFRNKRVESYEIVMKRLKGK